MWCLLWGLGDNCQCYNSTALYTIHTNIVWCLHRIKEPLHETIIQCVHFKDSQWILVNISSFCSLSCKTAGQLIYNAAINYTGVASFSSLQLLLTHWGQMTHKCVGNLTIIGSDNGLSPGRRQAIIWTNAGILLIGPLGTNFSEILIEIWNLLARKCIRKCRLENGGHFVSASMC